MPNVTLGMCDQTVVILSKNSTVKLIHPSACDVTFYKYFLKHESLDPVAKIMWDPRNFLIINDSILISFQYCFCPSHPSTSDSITASHRIELKYMPFLLIVGETTPVLLSDNCFSKAQAGYSFLYSVPDQMIQVTYQKLV